MVQFIRDLLSPKTCFEKVTVDSKGRISIPAWIRRNFLLERGSEIELRFDLRRNFILIAFGNGQNSVAASTEGCGPSSVSSILTSGPAKTE